MNKSENIDQLAAALARFQASVPTVPKSASGYQNRYQYAPLDKILETVRPTLNEHGLSVSQLIGDGVITTMLMHESGQYLSSDTPLVRMDGTKMMNDAQLFGTVVAYTRRYALEPILGISASDDTDATYEQERPVRQPARPRPARAPNEPEIVKNPAGWVLENVPRYDNMTAAKNVLRLALEHDGREWGELKSNVGQVQAFLDRVKAYAKNRDDGLEQDDALNLAFATVDEPVAQQGTLVDGGPEYGD